MYYKGKYLIILFDLPEIYIQRFLGYLIQNLHNQFGGGNSWLSFKLHGKNEGYS